MNTVDNQSLGAGNETPVDPAAVQADDALLDMLAGSVVITDDELSRVLYAWRRDVDAEPIPEFLASVPRRSVLARMRAAVRGLFRLLGGMR